MGGGDGPNLNWRGHLTRGVHGRRSCEKKITSHRRKSTKTFWFRKMGKMCKNKKIFFKCAIFKFLFFPKFWLWMHASLLQSLCRPQVDWEEGGKIRKKKKKRRSFILLFSISFLLLLVLKLTIKSLFQDCFLPVKEEEIASSIPPLPPDPKRRLNLGGCCSCFGPFFKKEEEDVAALSYFFFLRTAISELRATKKYLLFFCTWLTGD